MGRPPSQHRRVQLYLHADDLARLDQWAESSAIRNERGEPSRSEAVARLIRRLPEVEPAADRKPHQ